MFFNAQLRDVRCDQIHGVVHKGACRTTFCIANDLAPIGVHGGSIHAGQCHGSRVGPAGMAIDTAQPHGRIAEVFIQTGCRGEFIAVPQHLIPAAALNPFQIAIGLLESANALHRFLLGLRACEVHAQQAQSITEDVTMGVDQAGNECLAFTVDDSEPLCVG